VDTTELPHRLIAIPLALVRSHREHEYLPPATTLQEPNLVLQNLSRSNDRDISHIFLLHALLHHPKRTRDARDATFFYVPLGEGALAVNDRPAGDAALAEAVTEALHRQNPEWKSGVACHAIMAGYPSG
jgi:hypothetical protein